MFFVEETEDGLKLISESKKISSAIFELPNNKNLTYSDGNQTRPNCNFKFYILYLEGRGAKST